MSDLEAVQRHLAASFRAADAHNLREQARQVVAASRALIVYDDVVGARLRGLNAAHPGDSDELAAKTGKLLEGGRRIAEQNVAMFGWLADSAPAPSPDQAVELRATLLHVASSTVYFAGALQLLEGQLRAAA